MTTCYSIGWKRFAKDTWDKLQDVGEVNFGKYAKFDVLESRE